MAVLLLLPTETYHQVPPNRYKTYTKALEH
jgi:hypothetical protein